MFINASKRFLSLLLVIVIVFSMIPVTALPVYAAQIGKLTDEYIGVTSNGSASWFLSQDSIKGEAEGYKNTCDQDDTSAGTITIKNKRNVAATLSFTWTLTGGGSVSGAINRDSGTYEQEIPAGESIAIKLTSPKGSGNTSTLIISKLKLMVAGVYYTTIFKTPVNGSYTVTPEGESAQSITTDTPLNRVSTNTYDLHATAASGYVFFGWLDGSGNLLSNDADYQFTPTADMTISPLFITATAPVWGIGTKVYTEWDAAMSAASSGSNKTVALLRDATLPARDTAYVVPAGVTLLIPFNDANTCYKETPENTGFTEIDVILGVATDLAEIYEVPSVYRKLTMASGTHISVNGGISVSAKHTAGTSKTTGSSYCGAVSGKYGQIDMQSGSTITVNNGGNLYAWGYITGSGSITANSGAKVYELMQVTEFRGGSVLSSMANNPNAFGRVFPLAQYYVQNIEVELKLYAGATEIAYTSILAKVITDQSSPAEFIGANGMFTLTSGYVSKRYDGSTDRLILDVYGDVELGELSITMQVAVGASSTFNSSEYVLPINNNLTINVHSGTTVLGQDIALLPGAQVIVDEGATLQLADGYSAYIYDSAEWIGKGCIHATQDLSPIAYAPSKKFNRSTLGGDGINRAPNLGDCVVDINGQLIIGTPDGEGAYLYTTSSGAQIISSQGTGSILYVGLPGTAKNTYQYKYTGSGDIKGELINIPTTPAKLLNGDKKTYVTTDDAVEGDLYLYDKVREVWYKGVTVTYDANGGDGTLNEIYNNWWDSIYDSNTFDVPNNEIADEWNVFNLPALAGFTKTGYDATGWNTKADGTGTDYAVDDEYTIDPNDNKCITFYAQWEPKNITVTVQDETGAELVSASGLVGNDLTLEFTEPTKEGHTLKWKDHNGNVVDVLPTTIPLSDTDVTYKAEWVVNSYNLTWIVDGVTTTQSVPYGTALTAPDATPKQGYTFTGWTGTVPAAMPAADTTVTLTSNWTPADNTYTVEVYTMDVNGNYGEPTVETKNAKTEAAVSVTPESKTGFTVDNSRSVLTGTVAANGSTVLKVYYSRNDCTVTYEANGETVGTVTVKYGGNVLADQIPEIPVKEGYTQHTPTWNHNGQNITGDMTITAQYTINTYTVTYMADGVQVGDVQTIEHGKDAVAPEIPTKTGYDQVPPTWDHDGKRITEVTTIYAQYTANKYSVIFDVNGGSGTMEAQTVTYGVPVVLNTNTFTKQCYTFAGWNTEADGSGTAYADGASVTLMDGLKLYAQWTENHSWKAATCTQPKTCTDCGTTEGNALGHDWGTVTYDFAAYGSSCTAKRVCKTDSTHVETATATISSEVTTPATITAPGVTTYTATFSVSWAVTQTKEVTNIPQLQTKVETTEDYQDTDITEEIKTNTGYDTVEEIETQMKTVIKEQDSTVENTVLYEAKLHYSEDEGETWDEASKEHFPTDGKLLVTLPVPDGTHPDTHDYYVVHMFTTNAFGKKAGDTENPEIVKEYEQNGVHYIQFYVTGLSPIMVGYVQETHTVIFDGNGATSGQMDAQTIGEVTGSALTANAFQKTGYTFQGWDANNDGNVDYNNRQTITVADDVTLKAVWSINQYTITFKNGDAEYDTITADYDSAITKAISEPTRTGYTFAGWVDAGNVSWSIPSKMPAKNQTVYAAWTANSYDATFNANGGAWADGDRTKTVPTAYDSAIVAPADPTREGYTFNGWTPTVGNMTSVNGMTFTAQWTANSYDATFNANGGAWADGDSTKMVPTAYDSAIVAPADPTREGYTFNGWTPAVGNMTSVNGMTFTAQWTANSYDATFNANGGAWADGDSTKMVPTAYDSAIVAPADPTREGYDFAGWTPTVGNMTSVNGMTFTAQWTPKIYTITLTGEAIGEGTTITVTYGKTYAEGGLTVPFRSGYTFEGWYNGEQKVELTDTVPASAPVYLQARWKATAYNITYTGVEDSEHSNPGGYDVENLPVTLEDAFRVGYVFQGWTCEELSVTTATKGFVIPAGTTKHLTIQANFVLATASLTSGENTTYYASLGEAWANAQSGDVIALMQNTTEAGLVIDKDITIDFGNHTYTVNSAVGSYSTETLGLQILEGNKVILKNGELTANDSVNAQGKVVKVLIQNYADLTLDEMTLTANGNTLYCLSINSGNVAINDSTIIAAEGKCAFDAYKYGSYEAPVVTATNCTITGIVEVTGGDVTVENGTYHSNDTDVFVVSSGKLTINGEPEVTGGSKNQSTAVWAKENGHVVINGGSFYTGADESAVDGYNDVIYANDNAVVEITGGTFDGHARTRDGQKFLLNLKDNSNAKILVTGGTYIGFDPYDTGTEPAAVNDNFVSDGFIAVDDGTGTFTVKAHTHDYNYTASGSAIIEKCTEECRHSATAKLVKNGEISLVYTGSEIKPYSVEYSETWAGEKLTVVYENNTNAGEATAKITIDGATASECFTVANADLANVSVSQSGTLTYNKEGQIAAVTTAAKAVNDQTVTFTYSTELEGEYGQSVPGFINAGEHIVYFKASAPNHNTVSGSFTVNINKAEPTYTIPTGLTAASGQSLADVPLFDGWTWVNGTALVGNAGDQIHQAVYTDVDTTNYKSVTVDVSIAVFQPTIVFKLEGGKIGEQTEVSIGADYGTDVTAPTDPTMIGHTFAGWVDENGERWNVPATMPAKNQTVYATWTVNTYKVEWLNDDGTAFATTEVQYGEAITVPETAPEKTGHTFSAWVNVPTTMPADDIQIRPEWTVNTYDILLDTNGDGETDKTVQGVYNTTLVLEDGVKAADKVNTYTFLGWAAEQGGTVITDDLKVTGETTYYAVFQANPITYTITFDVQGGSDVEAMTGGYEAKITLPTASGKTGYTFLGWTETTDPNAEILTGEYTITGNDTLYAVWQINKHTITFRSGYDENKYIAMELNYGSFIPTVTFTREGYTFNGWDVEIPASVPDEDLVITALWKINTYTIGWDINEDGVAEFEDTVEWNTVPAYDVQKHGFITKASSVDTVYTWSGWTVTPVAATADVVYTAKFDTAVREYTVTWNIEGVESTTSVAYGVIPTWTGETPVKEEDVYNTYAFRNWADAQGNEPAAVTGEATYTAQFTPTAKVYTLTIDLDGGAIDEQTAIVISGGYGETIDAIAEPLKTGYTFTGWSESIPETLTETKTITALWDINQYTITFNTDGGTAMDPITQDYNTEIGQIVDPVKEGYTFTGWTPAIPESMPAENMEIEAGWTINQYTITFNTAGGSQIAPITQDYGTDVTIPADPEKEGYTFVKWVDEAGADAEIPATIPAGNVKLTAVWSANENTINFYTEKDEEEAYHTITAKTDEAIQDQLPANPAKKGHIFGGWVDAEGTPVVVGSTMPTKSMELYAKWNVNAYTITFELDGGKIGENTVYTIVQDFGTEVTAPADPEKEGYTFVKWVTKDSEDVETDYTIPGTMLADNVTVYAKWEINQYTITFQDDSGNTLSSKTLDYGALIEVPTVTKEGYTFQNWNEEIPGNMPAHDVTITSSWTINQYTITFVSNGGSDVAPITQDYGTAITAPTAPTKVGYTFAGWSPALPGSMPAENLTLTAQWTINAYTVTWLNHDGTLLASGTVEHGQTPVYGGVEPTKAETAEFYYTFSGWDPVVGEAAGNVIYTAQFAEHRQSYHVTLVYNNGQENGVITVVNGDPIPAIEDPEKDGYNFQGWNPELPEIMPAENISVAAQWSKVEYTITLDDGSGEPTVITAGWGEKITLPNNPAKEGHTFGGWENAAGEIVSLPETMPVGGLDLKAVWKVNQYTITFETDGGNAIAPITQDYNTAVEAPADPEKEGYTFLGWSPELPETMPAADITVVAQWKYTYTGWKSEEGGITYLTQGEKVYFDQWAEIDGQYYYFDDRSYVLTDICKTTSQDGTYEGLFVFDTTTGAFCADLNGVYVSGSGDTYYVISGEADLDAGLVRTVTDEGVVEYYYFCDGSTVCNMSGCLHNGTAVKNGTHWVEKNNEMLVKWDYTFDDRGVITHNPDTRLQGVNPDENGVDCYYIDGVKVHYGLFQIGNDYYYARSNGEIVKNKTYWISNTNGLLKEGSYVFDETGKIVLEDDGDQVKNGIYAENGSLYYYVDDVRTYAGLIEIDGAYYYIKTSCEAVHGGIFWITKTNGLMKAGNYNFDENGKMIPMPTQELKNGFYQENGGTYYYKDGKLFYAGLMQIDGYYYYVNSSCKLITGCNYWISKTNNLLPEKSYTFGADGRIVFEQIPDEDVELKNGILEENGKLYYYVDDVKTYAGLIEIDGYYYYVKSNCEAVKGGQFWITKTNGIMKEGRYTFDEQGRMVL